MICVRYVRNPFVVVGPKIESHCPEFASAGDSNLEKKRRDVEKNLPYRFVSPALAIRMRVRARRTLRVCVCAATHAYENRKQNSCNSQYYY